VHLKEKNGSVYTRVQEGYSENQLRLWLPLETPYIDLSPLCAVSQNVQRVCVTRPPFPLTFFVTF